MNLASGNFILINRKKENMFFLPDSHLIKVKLLGFATRQMRLDIFFLINHIHADAIQHGRKK